MTYRSITALKPEDIVKRYYISLFNGDVESLKEIMTERSYLMTLEALGLRRSFKDKAFKESLSHIEESKESLHFVESEISQILLDKRHLPALKILESKENGKDRKIVKYTEDDKIKKFYFSKENDLWKINYYAGRKAD
jgi:hypothetical protein